MYDIKNVSRNILKQYGIHKKYDWFEIMVPYYLFTKDLSLAINKHTALDLFCERDADIQVMVFSQNFNHPIDADAIPASVRVLVFGNHFNQELDNLPPQTEVIIFPNYSAFDCALDNLPVRMRAIILGKNYAKNLHLLPPSVAVVDFPIYSPHSRIILPPAQNESLFPARNQFTNFSNFSTQGPCNQPR